jgi:predicted MFS family arabinose efflux permease
VTKDAVGLRLSGGAVAVLAIAAGGAIANNYAIQPALAHIARDFGAPLSLVAVVASSAMAGYLLGLAFLVPLSDGVSPRALVPVQLLALAGVLTLAAAAPSPGVLIGCFVLIGALTTVAAQASAIVGKHSDPARRGARMGVVSAGISAGILLSRFVGGLLTDWIGWRGALLAIAAFVAVTALAGLAFLPAGKQSPRGSYHAALQALPGLLRTHPRLRRATVSGMLWFFAFNLVWVGLALRLAEPPYEFSSAAIGLYSLAGVLGLIGTRAAGRVSDRFGSRVVIATGLAVATSATLALTFGLGNPIATASALAFFDAGCFAAQVANQASIVAIDPTRAGALNAAYLTLYYAAGALGTAAAGVIVNASWPAITLLATAATAAAALFATRNSQRR